VAQPRNLLERLVTASGLILWLAQGFGVGRIPFAPGTWGSAIGLLWLAALLATGSAWLGTVGFLASFFASVWLSGRAEGILQQHDPPSVVVDEIVAVPLCFVGWLCVWSFHAGRWLRPLELLAPSIWPWTLGILLAFRFFDIAKPWPVRQSQVLPGGWGVMIDDLLAAIYVNSVVLAVVFAGKAAGH
jgi:phosphatidylglycerophosphatase A